MEVRKPQFNSGLRVHISLSTKLRKVLRDIQQESNHFSIRYYLKQERSSRRQEYRRSPDRLFKIPLENIDFHGNLSCWFTLESVQHANNCSLHILKLYMRNLNLGKQIEVSIDHSFPLEIRSYSLIHQVHIAPKNIIYKDIHHIPYKNRRQNNKVSKHVVSFSTQTSTHTPQHNEESSSDQKNNTTQKFHDVSQDPQHLHTIDLNKEIITQTISYILKCFQSSLTLLIEFLEKEQITHKNTSNINSLFKTLTSESPSHSQLNLFKQLQLYSGGETLGH